jgi:cytidylate kinase
VIRIITVEREYGSGGGVIAKKVADRLGWKLWDQLMTCEIARLCHCSEAEVQGREERVDPFYYRLFKSVLRGSFEGSVNLPRLQLLDADSVLRITEQVTQSAAAEGSCVIVGRGSQHFLRDRDDTLRIFLYAPEQSKVRRLVAEGMSEAEAEESVRIVDTERAAFIDKYFHLQWPTRSTYHAMLNTAFGEEAVVRTILALKDSLDLDSFSAGLHGFSSAAKPE